MGNAASICPRDERKPYVFLGGACGSTTWRADTAIPLLEQRGVNYYNPQTDAWVPELIQLENNAIEKATHLLFVMSPRVRGLTTFVEIAHYIGKCPDRVIVVDLWRDYETYHGGSAEETKDVARAREYALGFAKQYGLRIFYSIKDAILSVV
jgi:hypothetical protein